uniref:Uncharacterized protein n=1 Tax=Molossus molossus TaxID=27622 RepID=A0A7J8ERH8_MOLMO|nr:hypothetical protein HJG59_008702 [Molossus molossus]
MIPLVILNPSAYQEIPRLPVEQIPLPCVTDGLKPLNQGRQPRTEREKSRGWRGVKFILFLQTDSGVRVQGGDLCPQEPVPSITVIILPAPSHSFSTFTPSLKSEFSPILPSTLKMNSPVPRCH